MRQIAETGRTDVGERLVIEGQDRERRILQALLALLGGNDHLFQRETRVLGADVRRRERERQSRADRRAQRQLCAFTDHVRPPVRVNPSMCT